MNLGMYVHCPNICGFLSEMKEEGAEERSVQSGITQGCPNNWINEYVEDVDTPQSWLALKIERAGHLFTHHLTRPAFSFYSTRHMSS